MTLKRHNNLDITDRVQRWVEREQDYYLASEVDAVLSQVEAPTSLAASVITGTGLEGGQGKPDPACVRAASAGPAGALPATSNHSDAANSKVEAPHPAAGSGKEVLPIGKPSGTGRSIEAQVRYWLDEYERINAEHEKRALDQHDIIGWRNCEHTALTELLAALLTRRDQPEIPADRVLDIASRLESTFDPGGNLPEDCEQWAEQHQNVIHELRGLAECAMTDDDEDFSPAATRRDAPQELTNEEDLTRVAPFTEEK